MKKVLKIFVSGAVISAITIVNVSIALHKSNLSDVSLANIVALTSESDEDDQICEDNCQYSSTKKCTVNYPGTGKSVPCYYAKMRQ